MSLKPLQSKRLLGCSVQKKKDWIEEKMSRKDESHRRDKQKKEDWMGEKMSRDESCLL